MAYFDGYRPAYAPNPGYQYPQMNYQQQRMDFLQSAQQPAPAQMMQQPGDLQARIVTSREEAVAAQVLPNGMPFVFWNPNRQEIYLKRIDPQSGAAEFADFGRIPAQQPAQPPHIPTVQYATIDDLAALKGEISQLRDMISAHHPLPKGADAE
jgi:hypothetical protein